MVFRMQKMIVPVTEMILNLAKAYEELKNCNSEMQTEFDDARKGILVKIKEILNY